MTVSAPFASSVLARMWHSSNIKPKLAACDPLDANYR